MRYGLPIAHNAIVMKITGLLRDERVALDLVLDSRRRALVVCSEHKHSDGGLAEPPYQLLGSSVLRQLLFEYKRPDF